VRFHDDLSARCTSPLDNLIKVGNLEPKQNAMARRCGIGVDEVGVSFLVPRMQLQNEFTTALHSLVQLWELLELANAQNTSTDGRTSIPATFLRVTVSL
jgi:hypothetical protein